MITFEQYIKEDIDSLEAPLVPKEQVLDSASVVVGNLSSAPYNFTIYDKIRFDSREKHSLFPIGQRKTTCDNITGLRANAFRLFAVSHNSKISEINVSYPTIGRFIQDLSYLPFRTPNSDVDIYSMRQLFSASQTSLIKPGSSVQSQIPVLEGLFDVFNYYEELSKTEDNLAIKTIKTLEFIKNSKQPGLDFWRDDHQDGLNILRLKYLPRDQFTMDDHLTNIGMNL